MAIDKLLKNFEIIQTVKVETGGGIYKMPSAWVHAAIDLIAYGRPLIIELLVI